MKRIFLIKKISILILTAILTLLTGMQTTTVTFSATQDIVSKNWYHEELIEKRKILEAFWQKRIILYNKKSVDDFKSTIIANHFPEDPSWSMKIQKLFTDTITQKINFNLFFNSLKDQPLLMIEIMNDVEKLIPKINLKNRIRISTKEI